MRHRSVWLIWKVKGESFAMIIPVSLGANNRVGMRLTDKPGNSKRR